MCRLYNDSKMLLGMGDKPLNPKFQSTLLITGFVSKPQAWPIKGRVLSFTTNVYFLSDTYLELNLKYVWM